MRNVRLIIRGYQMQEKIHFLYTNDLHSNFEHWPKVVTFIDEKRNDHKHKDESSWLFDIGDHVDRANPIAEAFLGKANVELMNNLGYDVITIGNNEGITLSHDELYHLYDEAKFQVVCTNLTSMTEKQPTWLQTTVHLNSLAGVKIGVLGLTAPFNAFYNLLDWHVDYAFESLDEYLPELQKKADIIVLLSHLGLNEDRQIAEKYEDIDVIIGGHTHHLLRTGEIINQTIITSAGKSCNHVGEVVLTWDHQSKKVIHKEAFTTNITHVKKDTLTEQLLNDYHLKAEKRLSEIVIYTESQIEVNWFKNTKLMQELTNTLMEWTKADCAMLNAGLLLDEFQPGNITWKDIHEICPHPINPCVVEISGDELLEVIRASITKEFMEYELIGFGFRGKVIGRMIYSGLDIVTAKHKNGQEYVKHVNFQGKTLENTKIYKIATADTFTFGRLLPEIAKSKTKKLFLPEYIRDLLAYTLKEKFVAN